MLSSNSAVNVELASCKNAINVRFKKTVTAKPSHKTK